MYLLPVQLRAFQAARELVSRQGTDPLASVRWLRPQRAWLALDARIKLFRAGNQRIGKSWAGIAEAIYWARGWHPYRRVRPGPNQVLWISSNLKQSQALQDKFWALLPKAELDPRTKYDSKTRFGANNPMILFRNGSRITFRTDDQGPRAIQGMSPHYVAIDELCSVDTYREATQRIAVTGGCMGLTLTCVNAPAGWLREEVEAQRIKEEHARLIPESLQYADTGEPRVLEDGTICDAAWIAQQRAQTPPAYADVILDGEWEQRVVGQFFANFDPTRHVGDVQLSPTDGPIRWHLGVDYAAADRPFGQIGALVQVQRVRDTLGRFSENVVITDEVVLSGVATSLEFARGLVNMLDRNGLRWHNLTSVYGDNPVQSRFAFKGNTETMKALSRVLGMPFNAFKPRVLNAKDDVKAAGSRAHGCRYLFERLGADALRVRPRCVHTIEAFQKWDYSADSQWKDIIDGGRYALKDYIFAHGQPGSVTVRWG